MALPGLLTEPEPKSPLFFPRPGDACESLDSLFNLAQFCLLGAATSPEQVRESPRSGDLCYANLNLQEPNSGSSQRKASTQPSSSAQGRPKDVEYVTMAPFPREDIAYAALSLGDNENQEATYSNMGDLLAHDPSRSHEEPTEYSAVKKA
uniref:Uncharacterized protein n=1 Tax=Sus scrofa TaxID=9823 RepID=A0A8D1JFA1_PIG